MYQALYRKYRPINFDDVTGQEIVIKTLENAILNNKISHAYLFTGPRGTGKTSIAKILAKTVNCTNLKNYIPCDKCVNCTQIKNKQSTDIIEIDAASNNGVDEIREIRNKVNLVPSIGKYKIYIIDEVHMLTSGAFNALLKTLEEPPSHVIFILATTEPHKIPATILSRCQRFDFKRIPTLKIVDRLEYIVKQEKIKIEEDALIEIARLSDGGMRDSISLLDQAFAYSPNNITITDVHEINGSLPANELSNFIDSLNKRNITNILEKIDEFNESGKNLIKITEELLNYLKNVLLFKISPEYLKKISGNYDVYAETAKKMEKNEIIKLVNKFNNSINDIKISNDPKLSMEILMIKECSELDDPSAIQDANMIEKKTNIKITSEEENITIENKTTTIIKEAKDDSKNDIPIEENELNNENIISNLDTQDLSIEENNSNSEDFNKIIEEIKAIRINNTLSKFNKNILLKLKDKLVKLDEFLLDDKYSKAASIIIDGELKAASDEYIVFVFKTSNYALDFNSNLEIIQKLLTNIFDAEYKAIATDNIAWEILKKEFNSKTRVFTYNKENPNLENMISNKLNNEIQELDNIFGNIVEYD